ncbi:hypothetical protein LX36DRAFT_98551 [Colletotrichum falcatum]|nr:hypothetical protein LX36DRAFT_98551 [Colletotrichum falcatum]
MHNSRIISTLNLLSALIKASTPSSPKRSSEDLDTRLNKLEIRASQGRFRFCSHKSRMYLFK